MGLGRGLLLWLIGIPLPIIILIAIFMHHYTQTLILSQQRQTCQRANKKRLAT